MNALIQRGRDTEFKQGLRPFLVYRTLQVDDLTGGLLGAKILKAGLRPDDYKGTGTHYHELKAHFVYVIAGWVRFQFDGETHELVAGDSLVIPPGSLHAQVGFSDDIEMIEVTTPAKFTTIDASTIQALRSES